MFNILVIKVKNKVATCLIRKINSANANTCFNKISQPYYLSVGNQYTGWFTKEQKPVKNNICLLLNFLGFPAAALKPYEKRHLVSKLQTSVLQDTRKQSKLIFAGT
ncbi:hypothetical protein [Adhaeribacter pallidiroseus]|uniref:Uncharacterized protein n=1 Tax=Adhaeribacter pallidiroseus TaxID=2072847 RepID=A0A369QNX0_9BACT|nr:hypothetical protein [Adhaeribacter pallidiroseus]RDC64957.1 hypothetical protein AHMF7616_03579 [Adhaeribacter pallidiroseus]